MFVGVARFVLQIPAARSLKDRRQVVKSFKERLRARLPVSVSEVGEVERHEVASLGIATVARQSGYVRSVLSQSIDMARVLPDAVLADVRTEIVSFGDGGEGLAEGLESLGADAGAAADPVLPEDDDLARKWGGR